ncbi:MAG: hypothetical protein Q7S17_00245 [Xanthobacteraceae bacterium]|nr:hypothetical protein [Xanthobacteraceae bacterium]
MTIKAADFIAPTKDDLEKDNLAGLTDAERAAIKEAEEEDSAALKAETAAAAEIEAEAVKADAAAAKPEAEAKPKAEAAAEKQEKPAADEDEEEAETAKVEAKPAAEFEVEQPRSPRQAVPDWQAPADAEAKLKEIATQRVALAKQFDAGDLTREDELAQQTILDTQQRQIERAQDRAQMAHEMVQAVWAKTTVPDFLDTHAHYRDNETLYGMLDAEVRRLQVIAEKAGKDQLAPSILVEADKAIKASLVKLGVAPDAETAEESADEPALKPKQAKPAGVKPVIPPSLANIPASDIDAGLDNSKFASLDRLQKRDPLAYERAVAGLSPSEQEAYSTFH